MLLPLVPYFSGLDATMHVRVYNAWRFHLHATHQSSSPWRASAGLTPGCILTACRLGWSSQYGVVFPMCGGDPIDLSTIPLSQLKENIASQVSIWCAQQIANSQTLASLARGAWLKPLRSFIYNSKRKGLSRCQAGYIRSATSDCQWPQDRMYEAGLASENGDLCLSCRGAKGTLGHRHWECPVWDKTQQQ